MLCAFNINTTAQYYALKTEADSVSLNPLLFIAFKRPAKTTPTPAKRMKPSKYELMYWPNFTLTATQIEARYKRYDSPLGHQIASDITESYVNSLIYGKKTPVAVRPKF